MARRVFGPAARMDEAEGASPALPRRKPLAKGGAGAPRYIQGSADAVQDRSHEDIPVAQIQQSPIEDRIDLTEDLDALMESIEANGQQIPIIVRIVNAERPYEIVAGRRRLEAIRRLGRATIKGFVTRMSDEEAFVAQGIENSARLETSFIERARTAVLATRAGYGTGQVAEFLALKPSMVSMMKSIYDRVGEDLVQAIGPARGIGRRKWEALASHLDDGGIDTEEAVRLVDRSLETSSERFEALTARLRYGEPPLPRAPSSTDDGQSRDAPARRRRRHLGGALTSTISGGRLSVKASDDDPDGFLDYLAERIEGLRKEFDDSRTEV